MNHQVYIKRKEHRMKQSDVAKILGISPQSFHLKETGKSEFTIKEALRMTLLFDCTLDELFGQKEVI